MPDYRIATSLDFTYSGFNNGAFKVTNAPLLISLLDTKTIDEMKEEEDRRYSRIYDRIFETCYSMQFTGPSWRKKEASRRFTEKLFDID